MKECEEKIGMNMGLISGTTSFMIDQGPSIIFGYSLPVISIVIGGLEFLFSKRDPSQSERRYLSDVAKYHTIANVSLWGVSTLEHYIYQNYETARQVVDGTVF